MLRDMIDPKTISFLEVYYVADIEYEEQYKAKLQQHRSLCRILEKEGHEVKPYPIILEMQGSIFHPLKAAMTAVSVQSPQQMALARKLHDHAALCNRLAVSGIICVQE